jgi:oligopeptide/dipeptide ABC transporter ATP-binding protein
VAEKADQLKEIGSSSTVVEFRSVSQYFHDKNGGIVTAVEGVSLSVKYGEVMALVGESGSGKTTLGRLSVGLGNPSRGEILLNGKNLSQFSKRDLRGKAQYIHQDPYSALDPYLSVREVLERPLVHIRGIHDPERREEIMARMLDGMGLESYYLSKSVRELSGGQKQRILVARAFVIEPEYVVADEPTTMVDFVRRNEIMALLTNLTGRMGTAVLLITHDVSVASKLSNRVAVMYKGEIVESGPTQEVLRNPLHPYTLALLSVTPEKLMNQEGPLLAATRRRSVTIPLKFEGCRYSFTCPYVFDRCRGERPQLVEMGGGHEVACFKVTG